LFSLLPPPPSPTLFPYTTLFRSLVLECVFEFLLPMRIGAEGVARHRFARGVELQQLLRHVAHRLFDFGLRPLPRRAAQAIDGRRSEEHTSELQSRSDLVCRLLLE